MKFLDTIKNTELVVNFIENDENTLVIGLRGKVSASITGSILNIKQSAFDQILFNGSHKWKRVVLDLRGLVYINSVGAGVLISLHQSIKDKLAKIILLFKQDCIVTETLDSMGFFTGYKPNVVWNDYEQAMRS